MSVSEPVPDMDCSDAGVVQRPIDVYYEDGLLARIGNGKLFGIDWSHDGSTIAIASETGIHLIDAVGMMRDQYIETGHAVEVVRFSPDDGSLAVDDGSSVAVWDLDSGRIVSRIGNDFEYHTSRWVSPSTSEHGNVSFSLDGKKLVIHTRSYLRLDAEASVQVWDLKTRELVREWKAAKGVYVRPDPVYSPDGRLIATPWQDGVTIWEVENGEVVNQVEGARDFALFSRDGHRLITTDQENNILIVNLLDDSVLRIRNTNTSEPIVGQLTADGQILITHYNTHENSYIDTWDAKTGRHLHRLSLPELVFGFAVNPTRSQIATIDYGQNVNIWNLETPALIRTHQFSEFLGSEVYPSPDGSRLVVRRGEYFRLYDAWTGGHICRLPGKVEEPYYFSFNPNGREFASITPDGKATVWDLQTGRLDEILVSVDPDVQTSQDNVGLVYRRFAITEQNQDYYAWGWKAGPESDPSWIASSCDATSGIPTTCTATISPDGRYVAALDWPERSLAIRDLDSNGAPFQIAKKDAYNNYGFSPDGKYLLSLRFLDWGIEVWDVATQAEIARINSGMEGEGPILGVQEFSFTSDGEQLVTYLPYWRKPSIRLWNTKTWEMQRSFDTFDGIGDAKISGDGSLITGLSGYVVYLWHP